VPQPGNPQDLSRYTYVSNNPLRYVDPSGHDGNPPWVAAIIAALQIKVIQWDRRMSPATDVAAGLTVAATNQVIGEEVLSLPTIGEALPNGHQSIIGVQAGANELVGGGVNVGYSLVQNFENNQIGLYETIGVEGNIDVPPEPSGYAYLEGGGGPMFGFKDDIREIEGFATSAGAGVCIACGGYVGVGYDTWYSGLPWQDSSLSGRTFQNGIGIGTPGGGFNLHGAVSYASPADIAGQKLVTGRLPESVMRTFADFWWLIETAAGHSIQVDDPRYSVRQR
jgi:hypothetical protein